MSESMTVVYIEKTGHVVAALTRDVDTGAPELEAVVGAELPIRNRRESGDGDLGVVAPSAILAVKSVALDDAVLADPQAFVVDGGLLARLPDVTLVDPVTELSTAACTIEYDGGTNPPQDIEVLTIVRGPDPGSANLRVQSGTITTQNTDTSMALAILPGEAEAAIPNGGETYTVYVAFPGRRIGFFTKTPV